MAKKIKKDARTVDKKNEASKEDVEIEQVKNRSENFTIHREYRISTLNITHDNQR